MDKAVTFIGQGSNNLKRYTIVINVNLKLSP